VLQEGQQNLQSLTVSTLASVSHGQKSLMDQQENLTVMQRNIQDSVAQNLRELTREKAVIASSHHEFAKMMDNVRNKLGEYDLTIWTVVLETPPP
jgi:hypothetical protein